MAKELAKRGALEAVRTDTSVRVKHAKKAAKKSAKKSAKKTAKKAARREGVQGGLRTAFHHMQRAAVVISLMEKGTGEDLRELLERGVTLYERARDDDAALPRAIGVLRAAEHLALAGLYDARHKHRERVDPPRGPWLRSFLEETAARLAVVEGKERGKGVDVHPAAEELARRAQETDDPHLAYELVMAADALCFALENGL